MHLVATMSGEHVVKAASLVVGTHGARDSIAATHLRRLMLEIVAVAIASGPRLSSREQYKRNTRRQGGCLRVFPALVVDLVHVSVALVVGVLGFDIEYFGLIQELEVEAEHLLVLGVLGIVSLGWRHDRNICRVFLVYEVAYSCMSRLKLVSWWMFAAMVVALAFTSREFGQRVLALPCSSGLGPPRYQGILQDEQVHRSSAVFRVYCGASDVDGVMS